MAASRTDVPVSRTDVAAVRNAGAESGSALNQIAHVLRWAAGFSNLSILSPGGLPMKTTGRDAGLWRVDAAEFISGRSLEAETPV